MLWKYYDWFVINVIGRITWPGLRYFFLGREFDLTGEEISEVVEVLNRRRCIGLNYRKAHLTSYLISVSHFLLTFRFGAWSHVFVNVEPGESKEQDLQIAEAIGCGVKYSRFWEVLNCDRVLLLDCNLTENEWEEVANYIKAVVNRGAKYDTRFRVNDTGEFSCVELPYAAIKSIRPDSVAGMTKLIKDRGNLTPDMYLESGDFWIIDR